MAMYRMLLFVSLCLVVACGHAQEAEPAALERGVVELVISGIKADQETTVRATLDLARYEQRSTISGARLRRLLRETPGQVARALEIYGYYAARTVVSHTQIAERRHRVELAIDPGEPVLVAVRRVGVDGPAAAEESVALRLRTFAPAEGEPFDHLSYENGKAAVERALMRLGYFDQQLTEHRVEVTRQSRSAAIYLQWRSGERYRFGATTFSGAQFDDAFLRRYLPWREGETYDQAQIEALQQRLAVAGYFAGVEVEPRVGDRAEGAVPIAISMVPAKRSVWSLGAFVESNVGAGARIGLDRRWVNAAGHVLRAELEGSGNLVSGIAEYRMPRARAHDAQWLVGVQWRNEVRDAVDSESRLLRLGALGQWRDWTGTASLNALRGSFRVGSRRLNLRPEDTLVVYPEISATRVYARDRIRPERGGSLRFTARAGNTALGSDVDLTQLRIEGRYVMPLGLPARLLLRGEIGATRTDEFFRLPPELRLYAGGNGSVRGYGWQELGPVDADGEPIGGRNVYTASVEYERRFRGDWSWAVFADAGNVGIDDYARPRWGIGAGIRWASPIGPIRLDVARGLDDPQRSVEFYLSAGPDL
jgi:translocation and assembly module TamA